MLEPHRESRSLERRELGPREPARLVRVAPDGHRIAYVLGGEEAGIYVGGAGEAGERWASVEPGWQIEELLWSPSGTHVAYLACKDELLETMRLVRWCARPVPKPRFADALPFLAPPGAPARSPERPPPEPATGSAFAWTPRGRSLLVASSADGTIRRVPVAEGEAETIADLRDDGNARFPPRLAVSPDGKRVAWSCRRIDERLCEVWALERDAPGGPKLVTQIPGSQAHVFPFWSPKGGTLGIFIVHLELDRSALIAVPHLEGEGEVLHESALVDGAEAPAWSPSGATIVFQRAERGGSHRLVALSVAARTAWPLAQATGRPWFLGGGAILAVDGGASACTLAIQGTL